MRVRRRLRKLQRRRNAKRRRILFGICAALLIAFIAALYLIPNPVRGFLRGLFTKELEPGTFAGPYTVVYVTDGDTLILSIDGKETTVRMIGIDAPESVHRDKSKNTPEGAEASRWLKELVTGKKVRLEYDERQFDRYGRILAYVWLEDGTMLEDRLLREGLALASPMEPNERYTKHFEETEKEAKQEKAGFWGTGFFS